MVQCAQGVQNDTRAPSSRGTHAKLPPLEADYAISDAQVEQFWRDGFIVLRAVLSRDEVHAYGAAIRNTAMRRFAAGGMQASAHGAFLADAGAALR